MSPVSNFALRALVRTAFFALAGFILSCPSGARAGDEVRPCPNWRGSWQISFEPRWGSDFALSPQQAKGFADALGTVAEILHQTKVMNPPMGLDVKTLGRPIVDSPGSWSPAVSNPCRPGPCRTGPVRGELWSIFYLAGDWGRGCQQPWDSELVVSCTS